MKENNNELLNWLFKTFAIRISSHDKPFWYTSGTIGPYYINTHFLYGSEEKATDLLNYINKEKDNKLSCPQKLLSETYNNYKTDDVYRGLIDKLCLFIKDNIDINDIDYISGGERRDWFFSLPISKILKKPHIAIYKDLDTVVSYDGKTENLESLNNGKVLHIADLITEASSYERAWIPAIKDKGGKINWSVVVVDRKQGGEELLQRNGIKSLSMIDIDIDFFKKVLSMGIINDEQFKMLEKYLDNPKESMKNFLIKNPDFLEKALSSETKESERAKLCIEKNIYGLK
ncbi:orotate phosphoribosyltransferase [Herbivorax sp. ANBcel31]|uniref:orotate phosphoribosyltransferase n=1 Tax=Herbivorax sp. ANBcel31 TaxID=3069754 RepID=UPI0027AE637E|nr:orotate phosphoribosyltransferase [Herbivorax sp. ANBcel31]MDQ2087003.1 orotate phosphoribosyltransferase [Herbivorax sp. ANBcel31]